MIIVKEVKKVKKNGDVEYNYKFNKEFWQKVIKKHGKINVIIDEAHIFFNPRRSMSRINVIMSDFMSMLRRILGSQDSGSGELILITQLVRRIDVIAREMATNVLHCKCYYTKSCYNCGLTWNENNETPKQLWNCPNCNSVKVKKYDLIIHVKEFINISAYDNWLNWGAKSYFTKYNILDIEKYFKYYNSLQWEDMFSELIE